MSRLPHKRARWILGAVLGIVVGIPLLAFAYLQLLPNRHTVDVQNQLRESLVDVELQVVAGWPLRPEKRVAILSLRPGETRRVSFWRMQRPGKHSYMLLYRIDGTGTPNACNFGYFTDTLLAYSHQDRATVAIGRLPSGALSCG